jgi:hypothetical protein
VSCAPKSSVTLPVEAANIVENMDRSHGRTRIEVRSKHGDSHLIRFAQKADEEIKGRQRSGHQHGRIIAIAAIAPNGEMGRESVADANGT